MWIKITNCSVKNNKGKVRKNQNIRTHVDDDLFDKITKHKFITDLSTNYYVLGWSESFRTTLSSKVILPKEIMTDEQRLLFERKTKTKTLLNIIKKNTK